MMIVIENTNEKDKNGNEIAGVEVKVFTVVVVVVIVVIVVDDNNGSMIIVTVSASSRHTKTRIRRDQGCGTTENDTHETKGVCIL